MQDFVKTSKEKNKTKFKKKFFKTAFFLGKIRETEPEVRNILIRLFKIANSDINLEMMKSALKKEITFELNYKKAVFDKLAKSGPKLIKSGDTVFTHCHSRSVEHLLIEAFKKKDFEVICTETRPLFQGHKTAKALSKAGIKTTMMVDSAANSFMHQADLLLTGADAITAKNDLVNKIGTSQLSLSAHEHKVPHYGVSSIYKFDPITLLGIKEPIEQRPTKEVWAKSMKNLTIKNPSFDLTKAKFLTGYITEYGIIPTKNFKDFAKEVLYPRMDSNTKKWLLELVD